VDVDQEARRLYALPPEEFVAARDALAAQARSDGDRDAASRIKALRRPTVVAWLANLLARERPDEVRELGRIGAALREATATLSGDDLKALSRQQQRLVSALVGQAVELAAASGRAVGADARRGVEDTIRAALADADAAEALAAATLSDGLAPETGFPDGLGADGAVAVLRPVPRATSDDEDDPEAARAAAHRAELDAARRRAQVAEAQERAARQRHGRAVKAAEAADLHVAATADEVDRLRALLDEAVEQAESAAAESETADAEVDEASAALEQAEAESEAARAALAALEG
jgi:hypothetical protein